MNVNFIRAFFMIYAIGGGVFIRKNRAMLMRMMPSTP